MRSVRAPARLPVRLPVLLLLGLIAAAPPITVAQEMPERDVALLGEPHGTPLSGVDLDDATHEVASQMRCPVCQGLSVADSHVDSAQAMREKARALLAAGYSQDQVLHYFESSYGEFILLSPRAQGFNLVVWLLPVGGLLLGALVVWSRLRRRGSVASAAGEPAGGGSTVGSPPSGDDLAAYRERVRREAGGEGARPEVSE